MTAVRSTSRPAPLALKLLRPLDMQLLSRSQARFQGSVRVGQERFTISDASGMLCHQPGRVADIGLAAGGGS
jgi:hypothetical protein